MTKNQAERYEFIIIGGGIAGTTCAQKLCSLVNENNRILLLSASSLVKATTNVQQVTKFLRTFDVEEKSTNLFESSFKNLTILNKYVKDLDSQNHKVICSDESEFLYDKLCICTGGSPKLIEQNNELVIGIRDTETVKKFQEKLTNARKVLLVGNGGIATELAYEIENCDIIWAIKDDHITHQYFDKHSAKFFDESLNKEKTSPNPDEHLSSKRLKYSITKLDMNLKENRESIYGSALGPDWSLNLPTCKGIGSKARNVSIEYKCEVKRIINKDQFVQEKLSQNSEEIIWPIYAELTNNKIVGVDFIVSATGVIPSVEVFTKSNKFDVAEDGGLKVNDKMETNIQDVFCAGDSCTASWNHSPYWSQMRLWIQAAQMGDYAARSMWSSFNKKTIELDFCFEMFAHITRFFNYKVILLGNYAAKNLNDEYELLLRSTPGVEYVKVVIHNKRVVGVLLIGETDLEETFENLILNQIDVSSYGADLINPDIDIEDYFD